MQFSPVELCKADQQTETEAAYVSPQVFLPKPLPGDPEMPDEEAEEAVKRTTPGDPDPEQKPGTRLWEARTAVV